MQLPFCRQELLRIIQGRLINAREDSEHAIVPAQISTDTRCLRPGQLFLALQGTHHDGSDFLIHACERGACGAISTRFPLPLPRDFFVLQVSDTFQALHAIAAAHRQRITSPLVAVTGSNGKTTVKELLGKMLADHLPVYVAPGNRNNQIGVPLSLLKIDSYHRAAVLELGTNRVGEIDVLARLVRPHVGIITNVHHAHLAGLGTLKQVAHEKAGLIRALNESRNNVIVLNADDRWYEYLRSQADCTVVSFGIDRHADVMATGIQAHGKGLAFRVHLGGEGPIPVHFPCPGRFNVYNALAAIAACTALGIDVQPAARTLASYEGLPLRYALQQWRSCSIFLDCYNANPDSMRSALSCLGTLGNGRKVAVLGDMGELGAASPTLHESVGQFAASAGIDVLFACGQFSHYFVSGARAKGMQAAFSFARKEELVAALVTYLTRGDTLLVKGSRSMRMEEVVEMLRERIK